MSSASYTPEEEQALLDSIHSFLYGDDNRDWNLPQPALFTSPPHEAPTLVPTSSASYCQMPEPLEDMQRAIDPSHGYHQRLADPSSFNLPSDHQGSLYGGTVPAEGPHEFLGTYYEPRTSDGSSMAMGYSQAYSGEHSTQAPAHGTAYAPTSSPSLDDTSNDWPSLEPERNSPTVISIPEAPVDPGIGGHAHSQDPGSAAIKQMRQCVSVQQYTALTDFYSHSMYPTMDEKKWLGETLNMTPKRVTNWFINRRKKERRETKAHNQDAVGRSGTGVDAPS